MQLGFVLLAIAVLQQPSPTTEHVQSFSDVEMHEGTGDIVGFALHIAEGTAVLKIFQGSCVPETINLSTKAKGPRYVFSGPFEKGTAVVTGRIAGNLFVGSLVLKFKNHRDDRSSLRLRRGEVKACRTAEKE